MRWIFSKSEDASLTSNSFLKDKSRYVVVLTACIDPSQGSAKTVKVFRSDPLTRLADYEKSLLFWLKIKDCRLQKIVFVENSGYSLDSLKELVLNSNALAKQVEFISLCCNNIPLGLHYGYAELDMLDRAYQTSELIKSSEYFIKATGRLTFPNLPSLLNHLPLKYLFAVDCRNSAFLRRSTHAFTTTQLMIFSTEFYGEKLYGAKADLTMKVPKIEELLYYKLIIFKSQEGAILRWPISVDPVGQAAHWRKNYRSPRQIAINTIRSICRILFPNWWV
ncbi:MAG: hypothetical protein KME15_09225 [Drouetiella hepatica Uher 2000/2452]|jgi:hypothetical protein|uniref:Uncharacterized protein n=1 Tax=Drouetiella hepatica Uher 2000/2452 TaxID=904376 RepID=A0A951QBQ7_9CYAN|nr:hypothetical protein [Drouetiella hepatica Uher 2000/2452]